MARQKNRKTSKKKITLLIAAIIVGISAGLSMLFPDILEVKSTAFDASFGEQTKVHFIDIGQGDSVLLESNGEFALIDAGDLSSDKKLTEYLKQANVKAINYLIVTHGHADHIGAMDAIINNFEVKQVLMPQFDKAPIPTTAVFERLLDLIIEKDIPTEMMVKGNSYNLGLGVIDIIADGIKTNDQNNISPFIKFTADKLVYLGAGDAEKASEKDVLSQNGNVQANVFKASHHGSSTSNTKQLLSAVNPQVVVVSCGLDNSFGHPHKEVTQRLIDINAKVYRTDKNGTVIAYINSEGELTVAVQKGE